jgi:mannose-6-phosphate isomerase-like protein (cupin superfamily)
MKIIISSRILLALAIACPLCFLLGFALRQPTPGYYLEHEQDIKLDEPGTHDGGGSTTAFSFFSKVKDARITFRKRILHSGSAIGYHLQKEQEIYYIISGNGELKMNGSTVPVTTGDAILTLPGSSHGLKPAGDNDLAVMIVYENQ